MKMLLWAVLGVAFLGCTKKVEIKVDGIPGMSGTLTHSGNPTEEEKAEAMRRAQRMIDSLNEDDLIPHPNQ
jgi:hypothetical protein